MCTQREVIVCKLRRGVVQQGFRVFGMERWNYRAAGETRESEAINTKCKEEPST
jgi:hypothetical protein